MPAAFYGYMRNWPGDVWNVVAAGAHWDDVWRQLFRADLRRTGNESLVVLPRGVPPQGVPRKEGRK